MAKAAFLCAILLSGYPFCDVCPKAIQKQGFLKSWEINVHVPDFKKAVEHFCIHAGGRAVIDGIKENLKLTDKQACQTCTACLICLFFLI